MQRASKLFSESDRQRINECIKSAESGTSAEIVPVVATASGRYDRSEDHIGLWLGVLMLIAVSVLWPASTVHAESGSWDSNPTLTQTIKLVVAMVAGFLIGAVAGSRVGWLRRLFTPTQQMVDEVHLKARSVFFDNRIHHTQSSCGLLIYVSLFERKVILLADQNTLEALGQPVLDEHCTLLTRKLSQTGPTDALCETIEAVGAQLSRAMPRQENDANELQDYLVTID